MKSACTVLLLACTLPLGGCYVTTRHLPVPKPPAMVQTVTADQLVHNLNQQWAGLSSLTAAVEIKASVIKSKEGLAKDYTSIRGHILLRKPEMLRVVGQSLGVRVFDMASDGKQFTLSVPLQNKVVRGSNQLHKRSANTLENMRPGVFFDAMVVRGLEPDDLYTVTAETITVEDTAKKHLYSVPEYILSIMRRKPNSQELRPVRVVRFHRDDLLPYQQDVYDADGNLETQVIYSAYANFGQSQFPSAVTIKRPLEEYQVVLTVESVVENTPLKDDQFAIHIPDGAKIQSLD